MTGKGHTLYEDDLPKSPEDVWILLAESCYEVAMTLLGQNSYAKLLWVGVSGYRHGFSGGSIEVAPYGFLRYPIELFKALDACPEVHHLIEEYLQDIRRVQLRAECSDYIPPLFPIGSFTTDPISTHPFTTDLPKSNSQDTGPSFSNDSFGDEASYQKVTKQQFEQLQEVREKFGEYDAIGLGYEGLRRRRIKTYTPKRAEQLRRAYKILESKPLLKKLLEEEH